MPQFFKANDTYVKSKKVTVHIAFNNNDQTQQFISSRSWIVPRFVLHLADGQIALPNVKFLAADDDLAGEYLLIGSSVLQHLDIDFKNMLENNRSALDGTECSGICNTRRTSTLVHIVISPSQ